MHHLKSVAAVVLALIVVSAVSACGGDDDDSGSDAEPTSAATAAAAAATATPESADEPTQDTGEELADFSGEDVCALNTTDEVGAALGLTIEEAEPSDSGTPSCSYTFTTPEGTGNNVVVAVMRVEEDLGGLSGADGFEFAVELNRRFGNDAPEEEVSVGDEALFFDGAAVKLLIVRKGERVMTIAGTTLTLEAATEIAEAATGRI